MKNRNEINKEFIWDIDSMYENKELWQADIDKSIKLANEFEGLANTLLESPENLLKALKLRDEVWMVIEKAFVYSRMKRDEDNGNETAQSMCDKAQQTIAKIASSTSFFVPEILSDTTGKLIDWLENESSLETYKFALENIIREKDHILSETEEKLLAQMSELSPATNNIFTMLNNADLVFEQVTDSKGKKYNLSHGSYINLVSSHDAVLRENAYRAMYKEYEKLINTIATTYSYNTKNDVITSKIRRFNTSREAALFGDNVSGEVYDNLVSVVNKNLSSLHRYMNIRKKVLGLDSLKMQDVYVPLFELEDEHIPFEEAKKIINEGLAPLGKEYLDAMNKGLKSGWVDVYENKGKTSGAYSFGSYDSKPFILMNYADTLKDVFTLIHEMGHSMHSYYTRKTQPYIYGDHSIFTAEVASTVNEKLLIKYLINAEKGNTLMKKYLINYHLEEFRTTLFRQTMFAEFEQITHEASESGESLTPEFLCSKYAELNKKYFGDAVDEDDIIKYEWARIPHFYNAFYVYKYATGYSAASAIAKLILKNGPENYLKFLTTGSSNHPIELLKIAGIDMSSPKPIEDAMAEFTALVDELEALV